MNIEKLLENVKICQSHISGNSDITSVCIDSRKVTDGAMFIAIKGIDNDGHSYIAKAIDNGASAIVYQDSSYDEAIISKGISAIRVDNSRLAAAIIADNFYDHPSSKINLVGVTGTNGKTTIATLLYQLFTSLGYGCGLLSTIANYIEKDVFPTINTTSDPISINSLLASMADRGCEYCFMEVSSHALDQERVAGLKFRGSIFTNLTHDHLDYHHTFAEYLKCKKRLFDNLPKDAFALVNIDDKNGKVMVQNTSAQIYTYSLRDAADFKVKIMEKSIEGSLLNIDGQDVWTRFIGTHNAHNLIAVYGAAILLKAKKDEVLTQISALQSVSGRLEYIKGPRDITAVVDYAHTPDALENVLTTLRPVTKGRLMVLFGCGGDRDRGKRPIMGKIAAENSDFVIVTSDNPRTEEPLAIIDEIVPGVKEGNAAFAVIPDRIEAIGWAIDNAAPGDVILLAGKGHEDYQIIGHEKIHMDEREIVADFLKKRKTGC